MCAFLDVIVCVLVCVFVRVCECVYVGVRAHVCVFISRKRVTVVLLSKSNQGYFLFVLNTRHALAAFRQPCWPTGWKQQSTLMYTVKYCFIYSHKLL